MKATNEVNIDGVSNNLIDTRFSGRISNRSKLREFGMNKW